MRPEQIKDVLSRFFNFQLVEIVLKWTGYIVLGLAVVAFFYGIFLFVQYKYKVIYYEFKGIDVKDLGEIDITNRKKKRDWIRVIKRKGIEKWQFLLCKKRIEPISYKYIDNKNRVWMLRTGTNTFIPTIHNVNFLPGNHVVESIMPSPSNIEFWAQTELKRVALETVPEGQHKQIMVWASVIIFALLIFAAVTIWFILSAAKGSVEKIDILATAVSSLKGVGPG